MKRIAIIGCGYVGGAAGRELTAAGHDVTATTTTPAKCDELGRLGVRPVVLNLADTERLAALLRDREAVLLTVAPRGRDGNYREVYLEGIRGLLAALPTSAVTQIVYTSSTSVYAQEDGQWVDESSPTEPESENGRILLMAERELLAGAAALGVAATVLRLTGIYGPGRDPAERLGHVAGQERDDGDGYLNMVHLDDIVAALTALLEVPYHGVLNLNDDEPTPRRDYYDRLVADAGLPSIRWRRPDGIPKLGKRVRNDLIKRTLGLTLRHPAH